MPTISSHVLDSVKGTHAAGIRISCVRRNADGGTTLLFDKNACDQGRISEVIDSDESLELELVFHAKAYFEQQALVNADKQLVAEVVLRLDLPDAQGSYHCPIMLSPHSYSVWWSGT